MFKLNPYQRTLRPWSKQMFPQGRNGKHKEILTTILKDRSHLSDGAALKVPLAGLGQLKEKVRSAVDRAARKAGRKVATSSDATFLYVWNVRE